MGAMVRSCHPIYTPVPSTRTPKCASINRRGGPSSPIYRSVAQIAKYSMQRLHHRIRFTAHDAHLEHSRSAVPPRVYLPS